MMERFRQKVYLVRHGETEWSQSGKHTGSTDIPLTDVGKQQARWLARHLKAPSFTKVLCSPLMRARQTCEIAGLYDCAEIDDDLCEWDYGKYEGLTTSQIHQVDPEWNIFTSGAPDGESTQDISIRAARMIAKVHSIQGDVVLFSSSHFSRSLAAQWIQESIKGGQHLLLSTASCSILSYQRQIPVIELWNQTSSSCTPLT